MEHSGRVPGERFFLRKFLAPEFLFGVGALERVGQYATNLGVQRPLVVTDHGVTAAGWTAAVRESLGEAGLEHGVYDRVTANPRAEEVMAGVRVYRDAGCDSVVAVGGGSPMDCAKGIGIVVANGGHILDYEGVDRVAEPMPPMICVPTTGGTASELSQFAIILDEPDRRKVAIISKAVVPDVALIDPRTLTTMDPYLTACTGLDALVHAIEAFVSTGASAVTDTHALAATRELSASLLPSLAAPDDLEHRGRVMLGSLHAGLAFSNASLGGVHAMAHSLGGLLDLPHGECNALLLEHVIAFNFPEAESRYRRIGEALGLEPNGRSPKELRSAILAEVRRLRESAGVAGSLADRGVHRSDVADLSRKAMADPCMVTNPRRPTARDIEVVYEEAL
ncbi:MAG: alcohol dehydrogenase-like regulatory protein ErcA [Gemmatimonadota bacterium]